MTMLMVTVGLPGSGKTRAARFLQECFDNPCVLVSRDDIRENRFGVQGIAEGLEDMVTQFEEQDVISALKAGFDVIVHDMNLRVKYRRRWAEIAAAHGATYKQLDFTHIPLESCLNNNLKRDRQVPESVINDLHRKFVKPLKGSPAPYPTIDQPVQVMEPYKVTPGLPWIVLVDIDGTVAKMNNRGPHDYHLVSTDLPNNDVVMMVQNFHYDSDLPTVFMSGRPDSCRQDTVDWLYENVRVPFVGLHMRRAGDYRKDDVVKLELFNQHIRGKYNVAYVLDDRNRVVQMWRGLGLTCLQVAEGNF